MHWIEAGAPRGAGADPLLGVKPDTDEWKHGKPDLIVEVPAYDIPATGVIEYQYPRVKNPLGRDVWITAVEIHPGAKQAIHHIIAQDPVVLNGQQRGGNGGGNLAGFAPGMSPIVYPANTGVLFPKDADFVFQMHYTPNGQAVTDHSKVGFYFREADNPPKYPLRLTALTDFRFEIPPGAKEYGTTTTREITRDMLVYNFMPHSHLRGKTGKMSVIYPDGKEEILLNVPKYDFNWQTVYEYKEPKKIPAGSKLVWTFAWDNSHAEPGQPRSDQGGALGRPDVRGDGHRLRALPLPRRGSRQAGAPTQVARKTAGKQRDDAQLTSACAKEDSAKAATGLPSLVGNPRCDR